QVQFRPSAGGAQAALDESLLKRGFEALESIYDPKNGGFGSAPKFPAPHNLLFLLRFWKRTNDAFALGMVESTLQAMRRGGIYDHIGFGFHRYSTDAEWSVPHFEKMLYDQALLTIAYTEAYQATGKEEYAGVVREILEYVRREMTSEEGGFFSAEDADSEGEEGRYYLWSAEELKELLKEEDFRLLIRLFDIYESGNFEKGMNILRERSSLKDAASVLRISEEELCSRWDGIRARLLAERDKRAHPQKDDKILVDWNGLMIAALSKAAQALGEPKYGEMAKRAANFMLKEMRTTDGRLLHRYRGGADISAYLDDYAFLVWGLLDLYETLFDAKYLLAADHLNRTMMEHFWDEEQGGLFFTRHDSRELPVRDKSFYDGAIPSGNCVAMQNLLRLMHLTGEAKWGERAEEIAMASGVADAGQPLGFTMLLSSLDYALGPSSQIAIAGSPDDKSTYDMLKALRSRFLPNKSVLLAWGDEIRDVAPFTRDLVKVDGKSAAYVCSGQSCHPPVTSPVELMRLLQG
ncbi:MAG: thioredoxin domain-containing protein, partial [Methanothrix sp.]|nr:thioredoxin domain-containing protein [Methanothrix sp.]